MRDKADTKLVMAAQGGDTGAYGELFERYQQRIFSYAFGLTGNAEDAGDLTQEAFVRVFEMLPRKAGELNFSAYLYRTTHNLAMDAIRERGKFVASEVLDLQHETSLESDPEKVALLREQQEQTWRATFQLSEKHRSILALRELSDMSYQDIAEVMEMPRNTVGVLLSRARLQFKEAFRMSSVDVKNIAKECGDMLGLLSGYLDNELSAEEREQVKAHLDECAFCTLALEEMTEASKSYRALLPLLPPAALAQAVMGRVEEAAAAEGFGAGEPGEADDATGSADGDRTGPDLAADAIAGADADKPRRRLSGRARLIVPLAVVVGLAVVGVLVLWGAGVFGGDESTETADLDVPAAESTATVGSTDSSIVAPGTIAQPREAAPTGAAGSATPATVPTDTTPPPMPTPIAPAPQEVFDGPEMFFKWTSVEDPSGVTYTIEIETYSLDQDDFVPYRVFTDLPDTEFRHEMPTYLEQWRVWAVDGAGNSSNATEWRTFSRKLLSTPSTSAEEQIAEPEEPTLY